MGRLPTGHRKYHIKRLKPVHRHILVRLCWGLRPKDICEELGVSRNTISNVRNSAVGQREIARLDDEVDAYATAKLYLVPRAERLEGSKRAQQAHIRAYDHPSRAWRFLGTSGKHRNG